MTRHILRPASLLLGLGLALAGLACGDDPQDPTAVEPTPGDLAVTLNSPQDAEGAVLITLTGPDLPAPDAVHAAAPENVVLFVRADGPALRIALFGALSDGALLVFPVPDTGARGLYRATLLEVAAPDHTLRASLSGYELEVAVPD